jgi:hypothetical protein
MKKTILLFSCFCLPFFTLAQDMPRHKKPKATKDINVLDITRNQGTFLEYQTPAEVQEAARKEAALKMMEPEATPAGGYLVLTFSRSTIEAGNSRWFTIVATNPEGKEVFRQELDNQIPTPIHGPVTYWKNIRVVALPEALKTGAKVYVIDGLSKNRHEYLINN